MSLDTQTIVNICAETVARELSGFQQKHTKTQIEHFKRVLTAKLNGERE